METTFEAMINTMRLDATDVLEYFAKNIHFISEIGITLSSKVNAESYKNFKAFDHSWLFPSASC